MLIMGVFESKNNKQIKQTKQNKIIDDLKAEINTLKSIDKSDEINELREQLKELKSIDKNNDSIITREEVNEWIKKQKSEIDDFKRKISNDLAKEKNIESEAKYIEMKKQIESLQAINRSLEKKLGNSKLIETDSKDKGKDKDNGKTVINTVESNFSQKQIDIFIEKLLADPNVNIKYLPDFVERQLYRNIFTLIFGILQNLTDTTEIKLLGHKLMLRLIPDIDDEQLLDMSHVKKLAEVTPNIVVTNEQKE